MLKIVVVDRTAEERNRLVDELQALVSRIDSDLDALPRIDIHPLSLQELKFRSAPDICVVGPGLLSEEASEIGTIRKTLEETAIVARLGVETSSIALVEQLARLGIDDALPPDITPTEFLRRIVLLTRKTKRHKAGKLILVDSGKGGLGTTTVTAALADNLVCQGKRVTLVDFDFETQDLSRFLQSRPFINENLQQLLDRQRPCTQEYVDQCLVKVWDQGKGFLSCMSPVADCDELHNSGSGFSRTFLSIFEILDASADCVIVDVGCARGPMLRTLYRIADKILFIVNPDPAALYASTDRVAQLRGFLCPDSEIVFISNNRVAGGLPGSVLVEEFNRALNISPDAWSSAAIPHCSQGQRWPGSGGTLYSLGGVRVKAALSAALERLGFVARTEKTSKVMQLLIERWQEFSEGCARRKILAAQRSIHETPVKRISGPQLKLPEPKQPDQVKPALSEIDIDSLISPVSFS
jgi:MinD-like ATPase involved in chromosome partitioning or flagellar assembly